MSPKRIWCIGILLALAALVFGQTAEIATMEIRTPLPNRVNLEYEDSPVVRPAQGAETPESAFEIYKEYATLSYPSLTTTAAERALLSFLSGVALLAGGTAFCLVPSIFSWDLSADDVATGETGLAAALVGGVVGFPGVFLFSTGLSQVLLPLPGPREEYAALLDEGNPEAREVLAEAKLERLSRAYRKRRILEGLFFLASAALSAAGYVGGDALLGSHPSSMEIGIGYLGVVSLIAVVNATRLFTEESRQERLYRRYREKRQQ